LTGKPTVRFVDIKEKITVRDEVDENTGLRLMVIIDDREKVLQPHIDILKGERRVASYPLPTGARLHVRDGQEVTAGEPLVKIRREISKTRDITG
jgi:DNA-directed RNA polymerase subunit beta'